MNEILYVTPYKVDENHVYIKCPYCKKKHVHGSCGGKNYEGFRSPHCMGGKINPDYYIKNIGDAK